MKMTPSQAGRLSRLSQQQAKIDEYAAQYRPQVLEHRQENGYTYTLYEAANAEGIHRHQLIKPTGRSGGHGI